MATEPTLAATEPTLALAEFVAKNRPEDLPRNVVHEGKRALLNWLGCAIGASHHDTVSRAMLALMPFFGPAQASILGRVERVDTLHAPRNALGTLIGTETPGNVAMEFPKGAALRIRAGTILTFQMHYTAHGHQMNDRTSVGFHFAKEMPDEEIFASQFLNGSLKLPAGAKDVAVPAEITAGQPVRIWGMMPHTHLRGTRWQYTLVKPDSTSEVILDVPHYDFNWQTYYMFAKPLDIPAGSKIKSMAWYDNSASNKSNPDPTKEVKWGDQTWEEMQYSGITYTED